jgi:hypothetical protein
MPCTPHHPQPVSRAQARVQMPDVVTVPARQGLEAVDILRLGTSLGPVLHDDQEDSLSFLVPAGTAAGWDLPGSACTGTNGRAAALAPGQLLLPPNAGAQVTDPEVLRAALGQAARTIELADWL